MGHTAFFTLCLAHSSKEHLVGDFLVVALSVVRCETRSIPLSDGPGIMITIRYDFQSSQYSGGIQQPVSCHLWLFPKMVYH
jgi:hypothetical protein